MKCSGFVFFVLITEILMIILYSSVVRFAPSALPERSDQAFDVSAANAQLLKYPFYQDVHVMIFVGFGFLMTFLRHHSWGSVGLNFIVAALSIQCYILFYGLWYTLITESEEMIEVDTAKLITADYCAGAVLITMGGVLGKVNAFQLFVIVIIETLVYSLNEVIVFEEIEATDVGGSMIIHAFGAYFGLAVSWVASPASARNNSANDSSYNSNLFAAIGTIFLWMFWPSFNSAIVGNPVLEQTAIFNTVISLTASVITTFAISALYNDGKFKMEDILNASLAGGVIVGTCCILLVYPGHAVIFGVFAGLISTFGFEKINGYLEDKIRLHDTCGIHYLHGIPGLLGGLLSAVVVSLLGFTEYSDAESKFGFEHDFGEMAGRQLGALGLSLAFAIFFGLLTGCLIKLKIFGQSEDLFVDEPYWVDATTEGGPIELQKRIEA